MHSRITLLKLFVIKVLKTMSAKSLITALFLLFISFTGLAADPDDLELDAELGSFWVEAGRGREGNKIEVFYYKPKTFNENSDVIMVFADREREGKMARNRWIAAAKQHNLLVLSPTYTSEVYPTSANYDLGGILTVEDDTYVPIPNQREWIFRDFDRIFNLVVEATGSKQTHYDFFGHGASGELGHRLAMFYPQTKADRIVAANPSWYTVPEFSSPFPYGLLKAPIEPAAMVQQLKAAFTKELIVFVGEKDNENEYRGRFRRDDFADVQGKHRLERGEYFYKQSAIEANALDAPFNWIFYVVPDIGHNPTRMSVAAAEFLYGNQ